MKRKMNDILTLLKRGDVIRIANAAKVGAPVISAILHGKTDVESYPQVSQALIDYVKNREKELQVESKLSAATAEVFTKLKIKPLTNEQLLLRNLNAQKISRLDRDQLLFIIQEKRLKIKAKDFDDIDDLRDEVIERLGLEKESGFLDKLFK